MSTKNSSQSGQSLIELIIVIMLGVLIVGALTFATIASLRNSQLAKTQSQATKLAQEGLEAVRRIRDADKRVTYTYVPSSGTSTTTDEFSDLWSVPCPSTGKCYFILSSSNTVLQEGGSSSYEDISGRFTRRFTRQVIIEDGKSTGVEKLVTVLVKWTDFAGEHESKVTTILRNRDL
ncbi:prepilin-type N-terminal cleavage/methylation domain-containing protein [Candidatus Daviesbacteria bacterium]|nr:prepilin-type N-terminal cleavage/methylation domain-containing protein [Candidatus Daviesbacteria bacterium]